MAQVQLLKVVSGTPTQHSPTLDSAEFASLGVGVAAPASGVATEGLANSGSDVQSVTALQTSNYDVGPNDRTVAIGTLTGPITVTLPATPATGLVIFVKDVNGTVTGTNTVTISGSQNIDGAASAVISTAYGRYCLQYTGAQWSVLSN
jgi:hypothetical protein